jgi:hypothetical protein
MMNSTIRSLLCVKRAFNGKAIKPAMIGCLLAGMSTLAMGQTSAPFGFEDNAIGTWAGTSPAETATINSTAANVRTGAYSLKLTTTSTGTGNKQWFSNTPYALSASGTYIYCIYWALAANTGTSADASFRYSSSPALPSGAGSSANASADIALSTTAWTRVINSVTTSSARYYFPGPRKTVSTGATSFYIDDGIVYTSTMATVDTTDPLQPGVPTASVSGNLVSLGWTSNSDAGTGVAATLLLRNSNTSAAAPSLNDQAAYSAAGGSAGPNTVGGGWTVVSSSLAANATSFLDATAPTGNCIYAVVLRDLAYNYSTAAVSGIVNVGLPVPTIFVNQAGFSGNLGNAVRGTFSGVQQYSIQGYNLTGNITVTAPAGFEVSTTATSGFGSTISFPQSGGMVASATVYVRFAPTAATGNTGSLNITHTATGATAKTVSVSGNALDVKPTSSGTISFGRITGNSIEVNLPTTGSGNKRIIVISPDNEVTFIPADGAPVPGVNSNYQLAAGQTGNEKVVYDGNGAGNSVVTITGLTFATSYYFAVYEYNEGTGTSQNYLPSFPYTAMARTADFNIGVGVSSISGHTPVRIFPNPGQGYLHIDAPERVSVRVVDMTGRVVHQQQNATAADLRHLPDGIYNVIVQNEQSVMLKTERIIIRK